MNCNPLTVKSMELKNELTYKGTPVLKYSIQFPQFASTDENPCVGKLNRTYQNKAQSYLRYCHHTFYKQAVNYFIETQKGNFPFHENEYLVTYTIGYNQNCILSLYFDEGKYMGGANGTSTRTADTWSLARCRRLALQSFFPGNRNYAADIQNEVIRQIAEQIKNENGNYFSDYEALVKQYFDPNNFYITPQGLTVYFQEITIAPHSSGTVSFCVHPFSPAPQ